jgi:hypothetical protein
MIKLTQDEYKFVKKVYLENVLNNYLDKDALEKAYRLISNTTKEEEPVVSVRKMKSYIFTFFRQHIINFVKAIDELLTEPDVTEEESELDIIDNEKVSKVSQKGIKNTSNTSKVTQKEPKVIKNEKKKTEK